MTGSQHGSSGTMKTTPETARSAIALFSWKTLLMPAFDAERPEKHHPKLNLLVGPGFAVPAVHSTHCSVCAGLEARYRRYSGETPRGSGFSGHRAPDWLCPANRVMSVSTSERGGRKIGARPISLPLLVSEEFQWHQQRPAIYLTRMSSRPWQSQGFGSGSRSDTRWNK
jgi:hypothetical protein